MHRFNFMFIPWADVAAMMNGKWDKENLLNDNIANIHSYDWEQFYK